MLLASPVSSQSQRRMLPVWTTTILLVAIGLLAALRRAYVLLNPAGSSSRFSAGAALDQGFHPHAYLTFFHIAPAALLIVLMPSQFVAQIRARHPAWHRW